MTALARVSGAWKTVTALAVKVSGAWKTVSAGYVKVSGVWKPFYSASSPPPDPDPIIATATPDTLTWNIVVPGSQYASDASSTVSASGGTGPYTYAWERVEGASLGGDQPDDPTHATTTFSSPFGNVGTRFRCLVSDALGASAYSNDVTVN